MWQEVTARYKVQKIPGNGHNLRLNDIGICFEGDDCNPHKRPFYFEKQIMKLYEKWYERPVRKVPLYRRVERWIRRSRRKGEQEKGSKKHIERT